MIGHQASNANFDDKYQHDFPSKLAVANNATSAMLQLISSPSLYNNLSNTNFLFTQGLGTSFLPNAIGGWASDYFFPDVKHQ